LLSSILGDAAREFKKALHWLQKFTESLQNTQRAIYRVRHLERVSKEAKSRHAAAVVSWKKRKTQTSQTLFAAWNIPY
jgi:hypothetical protein